MTLTVELGADVGNEMFKRRIASSGLTAVTGNSKLDVPQCLNVYASL